MSISSSTNFNLDVSDIVEEAFERAGLEMRSGQDLSSGKRSLNLLLLEWANKGLNLWTIDQVSIPSSSVLSGVGEYDIDDDTIAVLDVVIRKSAGASNQLDRKLWEISAATYAQIGNKELRGEPTQFWVNRVGVRNLSGSTHRSSKLVLWPIPNRDNFYTIVYFRMRRMADAGTGGGSHMEVPDRFLPALVAGLALKIAQKRVTAFERIPMLSLDYDNLLREAMEEDRERQDLVIVPDVSGYSPLNG